MEAISPFEPTVLGAVRRHWQLVAGVVALVVGLAAVYSLSSKPQYGATASLTVTDPRGPGVLGGQERTDPERYVSDQLAVFDSAAFGERAAALGAKQKPPLVRSPQWFTDHTTGKASAQDSNLVSVSFSAESRSEAMTGLRVAVRAYQDMIASATGEQAKAVQEQLDAALQSLDSQIGSLASNGGANAAELQQLRDTRAPLAARREQVAGEASRPSNGVTLALLPSDATSNGRAELLRRLVLAIAIGTLAGVGLAYVLAYRNRVFVSAADPEVVLECPLLIDVSHGSDARQPKNYAVAAALLRSLLPTRDSKISLTIVTAGSDRTAASVAVQLADAFAREDLRVALVDPTEATRMEPAQDERTPLRSWNHVPAAVAGAVAHTGLPDIRDVESSIRKLEIDFDVVVISAPSFLHSELAPRLVSATQNAVVVVSDRSSVTAYDELSRRLRLTDITPLAYVYCPSEPRVRALADAVARATRRFTSSDDAAGVDNAAEAADATGGNPGWSNGERKDRTEYKAAPVADVKTQKASGWGT